MNTLFLRSVTCGIYQMASLTKFNVNDLWGSTYLPSDTVLYLANVQLIARFSRIPTYLRTRYLINFHVMREYECGGKFKATLRIRPTTSHVLPPTSCIINIHSRADLLSTYSLKCLSICRYRE